MRCGGELVFRRQSVGSRHNDCTKGSGKPSSVWSELLVVANHEASTENQDDQRASTLACRLVDLDLALEAISHSNALEAFFDVRSCWTQCLEPLFSHLLAHCAELFDVVPIALGGLVLFQKLYGVSISSTSEGGVLLLTSPSSGSISASFATSSLVLIVAV